MTSSLMRVVSGFAGSIPKTYYPRISGRCFTQAASSLSFVICRFQSAKESTSSIQDPNTDLSYTMYWKSTPVSQPKFDGLSATQLLLILLLITATGITLTKEAQAEGTTDSDSQLERVSFLLGKKTNDRTIEERIELFNVLLSKGKEEGNKAEGKDILLVFGNTGAGKSTLINFIHGCKMAKDEDGNIVVDPKSPLKEIAPIGVESHSCTFIPKEIPDISFSIPNTSKNEHITCFDMPGLSDDRGVEVSLANAIIMRHVIEKAGSVRFIMVFEESQLTAEKGAAWKKAVDLLYERFDGRIGNTEKSLCLVITKGGDDLASIQKNIGKHTPDRPYLSNNAVVYNPLNTEERENLLNRFHQTKRHAGLDIKIAMGGEQRLDAIKLGEKIQQEIRSDLAKANGAGICKAVSKIQFTHGITRLQGEDLTKPHESAEKAVQECAEKFIDKMKSAEAAPGKIYEYKRYQSFKKNFDEFVNFEESEGAVRNIKYDTKDPRRIAWDKPETGEACGAATVAFVATALIFPAAAIPAAMAAGLSGCGTIYAFKHWCRPSQEEKDYSEFCQKT